MSTHTPGKWEFDGEYVWANSIGGYIANPQTEDMLSGEFVSLRDARRMIAANGRLIAAAPDLLLALQMLHDETADYIRLNNLVGMDTQSMKMARAAIARATGGIHEK